MVTPFGELAVNCRFGELGIKVGMSKVARAPPSDWGLYGSAASVASNMLLASAAELVGTFMLVLVGTAVATAAGLGKTTAGPAYDSLAVALSFGLILVPVVGALGPVSGAHVNPAVTVGLAVSRKFPWKYVPAYLAAQLAGAVLASLVLWVAYGNGGYLLHLGAPAPANGADNLQVLVVEALIAFILVFTVMATATDPRAPAGTAALAIGFALSAGVLLGGPVSGGAGNPARALGPMIVSNSWTAWPYYVLGPLIGGVAAALLYRIVGAASSPSAPEDQEDVPKTAAH